MLFVHNDGTVPRKDMDLETWMSLNRGIEDGDSDIPTHVQRQVHDTVCRDFIPEIALALSCKTTHLDEELWRTTSSSSGTGCPQAEETEEASSGNLLSAFAIKEGWVQLRGDTLIHHLSTAMPGDVAEEASSIRYGSSDDLGQPEWSHKPHKVGRNGSESVWMSLCSTLLFFSIFSSSSAADRSRPRPPNAYFDMNDARIVGVDSDERVITLTGNYTAALREKEKTVSRHREVPLSLIILLMDARWTKVHIAKLGIKLATDEEFESWLMHLSGEHQAPLQKSFSRTCSETVVAM